MPPDINKQAATSIHRRLSCPHCGYAQTVTVILDGKPVILDEEELEFLALTSDDELREAVPSILRAGEYKPSE
jgi:hypothetical protein